MSAQRKQHQTELRQLRTAHLSEADELREQISTLQASLQEHA